MDRERRRRLPLAGEEPEPSHVGEVDPASFEGAACEVVDGCLVCGDVAVPVTVVETGDGGDPVCRDPQGNEGHVATDLVGPVGVGDRLLVHAGVAIERLDAGSEQPREGV